MRLEDHKLDTAEFMPARWTGSVIKPEIVVLHDTAGRLEKGNSARYLAQNEAKVSVHFVIERDGTIVQLVQTNHRANHCGQSSFQGRKNCNDFSIGVEIVNPGKMTWVNQDEGLARAWFGELFADDHEGCDVREVSTPEHGTGVWMSYTSLQVDAVIALLTALFRDIESLRDITTHWYISPGRKVDVNPLFPLEQIRARVLGRDDPALAEAEKRSRATTGTASTLVRIAAPSGLNMRAWPSFNPNIITSIPDGTLVPVQRSGRFAGRKWHCVLYAGQEGWIVADYTKNPN